MIKKLSALFVLQWALLSLCVYASPSIIGDEFSLPPGNNYKRFKTEHFELIFPNHLESTADEAATYLEEAHTKLTPYFNLSSNIPTEKVVVILSDNLDLANGLATPVGKQGLSLLVAPPDPYSSIGDYDNWLRNLVIHEYTHYLTLSPRRGYAQVLKILFGDVIYPNASWPSWLSEGLAVYAETKFSKRGRGNSTYYATLMRDGLLRNLYNENRLSFNQIMGPVPHFPFGETAYFVGYYIVDEISKTLGESAHKTLVDRGSGRIPYFLNGTLQSTAEKLGKPDDSLGFRTLWENSLARLKTEIKPESATLKSAPQQVLFSEREAISSGARINAQETLVAFTYKSGHERQSLRLLDLKTLKTKSIDEPAQIGPALSWSEDGGTLYYVRFNYRTAFEFGGDIFSWSEDKGTTRITSDEKVKDVTACGKNNLIYSKVHNGLTALYQWNLDSKTSRILYMPPSGHRVSNPRCTPDSSEVYFSVHGKEPFDGIYKISFASQRSVEENPTAVVGGGKTGFGALYPEPTQDGLYFTKQTEKFYELSLLKNGKVYLISRASGGHWLPSNGSSQILTTYVTASGFEIARFQKSDITQFLSSTEVKDAPHSEIQNTSVAGTSHSEKSSYWFFRSLLPRMWSPSLILTSNHQEIGGYIFGWDDIDQVRYLFYGAYDTIKEGPIGAFNTSHRLPWGFRADLGADNYVDSYFKSTRGRGYFEKLQFYGRLSRPIPFTFSTITPYVSTSHERLYFKGDYGKQTLPQELRTKAGLIFNNVQSVPFSITSEWGYTVSLEGMRIAPARKADLYKYSLQWQQLIPFYPKHSTWLLKLAVAGTTAKRTETLASQSRPGEQGSASDLDLPLRGYSRGLITGRRTYLASPEFRMPLGQIFRASDTFPFFSKNIGVYAFGDLAKLQYDSKNLSPLFASVGGGFLMNVQLGYLLPVNLKIEIARGLNKDYGAETQFTIGMNSL